MILCSQIMAYNKFNLSYQPNNNPKSFNKFFHSKIKTNHTIFMCNYYGINGLIALYCEEEN